MSDIKERLKEYFARIQPYSTDELAKLLLDSLKELESAQKACAEKDDIMRRLLYEFMLEHSLESDCGKDFIHKSQLDAANKRIEKFGGRAKENTRTRMA